MESSHRAAHAKHVFSHYLCSWQNLMYSAQKKCSHNLPCQIKYLFYTFEYSAGKSLQILTLFLFFRLHGKILSVLQNNLAS